MSKLEDHCQESIRLFGAPYEEVHRWLDEFQGTERYRMRHRRVRHHEAGIQQAIRRFGEKAGAVARQHIISDLKEEGWTERDPLSTRRSPLRQDGAFLTTHCEHYHA